MTATIIIKLDYTNDQVNKWSTIICINLSFYVIFLFLIKHYLSIKMFILKYLYKEIVIKIFFERVEKQSFFNFQESVDF